MDGLHGGLCLKVEVLTLCDGLVSYFAHSLYRASRVASRTFGAVFNRESTAEGMSRFLTEMETSGQDIDFISGLLWQARTIE